MAMKTFDPKESRFVVIHPGGTSEQFGGHDGQGLPREPSKAAPIPRNATVTIPSTGEAYWRFYVATLGHAGEA